MGLDVTAYRKLQKVDAVFDDCGEPIDPETRKPFAFDVDMMRANPDFPGRELGIEGGAVYRYEDARHAVSIGYSSYNHWRDQLAKLAGWAESSYELYGVQKKSYAASAWAAASGPFWELINFSDCEGVIGSVVSTKLLADFEQYKSAAEAHEHERFRQVYEAFREAFAIAADGGAVKFH